MAKTMINIKTDTEVKMNAKKLANELGLSLSDVINASLRNFIRTREVRVSAVPYMTAELEKLLGKIEQDISAKKNISRGFSKEGEAIHYLETL